MGRRLAIGLATVVGILPLAARGDKAAVLTLESLSFDNPFTAYADYQIPGWEYGGSTFFTDDFVALTPPAEDKIGWMWSEEPVIAREWEIDLEFHIGGPAARGAGGGLALWLTFNKGTNGSIYGHDADYNGLGIFFDTYEGPDEENNGEPFVVAMMNYGKDLSNEELPEYSNNQVGVCFADYRNREEPVTARISHRGGVLSVLLDRSGSGEFASCFATEPGDKRLKMPPKVYLGITASTGAYVDSHVVYSLSVRDLTARKEELPHEPKQAHTHPSTSGAEAAVPVGKGAMESHKPSAKDKDAAAPRMPVPKPKHHKKPDTADEGKGSEPSKSAPAATREPAGNLEARLHALESSLQAESEAARRRHQELMGCLRSIMRPGSPPTGSAAVAAAGGGDAEVALPPGSPASVGTMAADIKHIRKSIDELADHGGLAQLSRTLETQLETLSAVLMSADAASGEQRGKEGAGFQATADAMHKMQQLVIETSEKLQELHESHKATGKEQATVLSQLRSHILDLGTSHQDLHGKIGSELKSAAEVLKQGAGSSGDGWLGKFVVVQMLLAAVFLFYQRATAFKDKKLL